MTISQQRAKERARKKDDEIERRRQVTAEQDTEVEALSAIYGSDFVECQDDLESYDIVRAFDIKCQPFPGQPTLNHSFIVLRFLFPREYPHDLPIIRVVSSKGLNNTEIAEVLEAITKLASHHIGDAMVYDLVSMVQDFLVPRNRETLSVYDQMIRDNVLESQRKLVEQQRDSEQLEVQRLAETRARAEMSAVENLSSQAETKLRQLWLQKHYASCFTFPLPSSSVNLCEEDSASEQACASTQLPLASSSAAINSPQLSLSPMKNMYVILAHLLRIAAPQDFSELLSECSDSGIVPADIASLLRNPDTIAMHLHSISGMAKLKALHERDPEDMPAESRSRYRNDFKEVKLIGAGSYGRVMKVQNRLDGRFYAVKIIEISSSTEFHRILREVTTLSRLSHPYVLRYFNAWVELSSDDKTLHTLDVNNEDEWGPQSIAAASHPCMKDLRSDSLYREIALETTSPDTINEAGSSSPLQFGTIESFIQASRSSSTNEQSNCQTTSNKGRFTLYIQTEFCPRDLRATISREARTAKPEDVWRRFRQVVEGIAHIHSQSIVHRDLKPSNILVTPEADVRIGDFGLAIEPLSSSSSSSLNTSCHMTPDFTVDDNNDAMKTRAAGTLLYMAPEQCNGLMQYDEKVDMFSLGIILFELVYPFATAHERVSVLQRLRSSVEFPHGFEVAHPRQTKLISWLLAKDPQHRPTALDLLHSQLLPPKLEDEYMKDALRTISDPTTPFYHRLLCELFNAARPMPSSLVSKAKTSSHCITITHTHTHSLWYCMVLQVDTSSSRLSHDATPPSFIENAVLRHVVDVARRMFECHSAQRTLAPHLLSCADNTSTDDEQDEEKLLYMNRDGELIYARADLRASLLTLIRSGRAASRCYQIGTVFRSTKVSRNINNHTNNGCNKTGVRQNLQCDFDVLDSKDDCNEETHVISNAEILSMLHYIVDELVPLNATTTILIGHVDIARAALDACGVCEDSRAMVLRTLTAALPSSGEVLRGELEALTCVLSPRSIGALLSFAVPQASRDLSNTLTLLHNSLVHNRAAIKALDTLRDMIDTARILNASQNEHHESRLAIAPLLFIGKRYNAMLARVIVSNDVTSKCVAIAGRYAVGVGLSIAAEQLRDIVVAHQRSLRSASSELQMANGTRIFVATVGASVYDERLRVVGELWRHGESAGMLDRRDASLEEQVEEAHQRHAQFLITIKDKYFKQDGTVRLRQLGRDAGRAHDTILQREDIPKFFAKASGRRK